MTLSPLHLRIDEMLRKRGSSLPAPAPVNVTDDEAHIREEFTVNKFGGPAPSECRPEDLIESVVLVMEDGVIIQQTSTPGPAASRAGEGG